MSLLGQFSEWAFRTEVERYQVAAEEAGKHAAVQHELDKIRMWTRRQQAHVAGLPLVR